MLSTVLMYIIPKVSLWLWITLALAWFALGIAWMNKPSADEIRLAAWMSDLPSSQSLCRDAAVKELDVLAYNRTHPLSRQTSVSYIRKELCGGP